jgi:hypothetical protein
MKKLLAAAVVAGLAAFPAAAQFKRDLPTG